MKKETEERLYAYGNLVERVWSAVEGFRKDKDGNYRQPTSLNDEEGFYCAPPSLDEVANRVEATVAQRDDLLRLVGAERLAFTHLSERHDAQMEKMHARIRELEAACRPNQRFQMGDRVRVVVNRIDGLGPGSMSWRGRVGVVTAVEVTQEFLMRRGENSVFRDAIQYSVRAVGPSGQAYMQETFLQEELEPAEEENGAPADKGRTQ